MSASGGAHFLADDQGFGDGFSQLVELCGSQDRPWEPPRGLGRVLLSDLAADVSGFGGHLVCADDGQHDVVSDAGFGGRSGEGGRGLFEESFGGVVGCGGIDHVDDNFSFSKGVVEALPGEQIYTGSTGGCGDVVASVA